MRAVRTVIQRPQYLSWFVSIVHHRPDLHASDCKSCANAGVQRKRQAKRAMDSSDAGRGRKHTSLFVMADAAAAAEQQAHSDGSDGDAWGSMKRHRSTGEQGMLRPQLPMKRNASAGMADDLPISRAAAARFGSGGLLRASHCNIGAHGEIPPIQAALHRRPRRLIERCTCLQMALSGLSDHGQLSHTNLYMALSGAFPRYSETFCSFQATSKQHS